MDEFDVHASMHVTGGGLVKISRMLSRNSDAYIEGSRNLQMHDIFRYIHDAHRQSNRDMPKRFNCGIGYVLAVRESAAQSVIDGIRQISAYPVDKIGSVEIGKGRFHITSPFDGKFVTFPEAA